MMRVLSLERRGLSGLMIALYLDYVDRVREGKKEKAKKFKRERE